MPKLGGFSPFPLRCGGGRPRVETIVEALNADRGDAFDVLNRETVAYAIDHAIGRAISAAWGTNQRLAQLWDPERMSEDVLARWEKILVLGPAPTATVTERRAALRAVFERFGQASLASQISAQLQEEIGDAFVGIETISIDLANILVPDGTYPWGAPGSVPWSSTVAHLLVRLQKPAGWTEGQFYDAAGRVVQVLDPLLPAWVSFDWYRAPDTGVAVDVAGGPSAAGFYLDDEHNLDNNVFDS